ncbi:cytochrome P450 family protein [Nocardia transvalensis]|uniref:cytochrome P450 family protein n=1 Tax=Nocardia transvalensis TaxID=37333 RepID=UPI001892D8B4|nr:cytochrome P450 [Nocardia transvalensis]MBF6327564.1 cytochrome P450 [Nocardia transvalensis]
MGHETASETAELATEPVELTDDFYLEPHLVYERLRSRGPVHYVRFPDSSTGWLVTDYEVAKAAFADPTISKALRSAGARAATVANNGGQLVGNSMFEDMMVFYDPPEHTRLRSLVNRAFGSRAVRDSAPRVAELADSLLADMTGDAQDLLEAYAIPLPMKVICELLGVPHEDRDSFRTWSTILMSGEQTKATRTAAVQEFVAYLDQLIHTKRAAPENDLLSELIAARENGDRLTHRELLSMIFVLLVAGYETSVNLIGNAVAILLTDNNSRRLLRTDPGRIPAFIEEVLRYQPPAREATFRYTTTPTTLGDTEIPAGQLLVVSMAAANRDPHRFPDPNLFDLTRPDNHHIAFGHGIHHCVGAHLARMEGTVALSRLLSTYPNLELAEATTLQWRKSLIIRGLTALPVRLRP